MAGIDQQNILKYIELNANSITCTMSCHVFKQNHYIEIQRLNSKIAMQIAGV
jgi:hypothetical protein